MDQCFNNEKNGEEENAVNPCPPEWLEREDNALLRGDAIGDTAYTHRWVLSCLYTITKDLPKFLRHNNTTKKEEGSPEGELKIDTIPPPPKNKDSSKMSDSKTEKETSDEIVVVELDYEVENAACQLWDMTVEKDVSLHLLHMEEVDFLHLISVICEESCAPRLTEVMVGVVANLCCVEDCCEKMLAEDGNAVLLSALHLLGSTSDVPTLCEVMRLIRLLLWHRTNRTQNTSWASCPLLKLLCQDLYRNALTFLLKNSLSDSLICSLLELLSNFLFICLPEIGLNVASLYSTEEIITRLIEVFDCQEQILPKHRQDEQEKIRHLAVMCLYSFIDTPGAKIMQSLASPSHSKLEGLLNSFMEHEGRIESLEQLEETVCDHLIHALGVARLLISSLHQPTLIITVGKLMALIHGETRQYSVSRSSSREERARRNESVDTVENLVISEPLITEGMTSNSAEIRYHRQISNPLAENCGWVSPPLSPPPKGDSVILSPHPRDNSSTNPEKPGHAQDTHPVSTNDTGSSDTDKMSSDLEPNLKELKEVLEDYCYELMAYWWSLSSKVPKQMETQLVILDILDQCHAHEVLFIFKAVRVRDPTLVPRLQEQILDMGSHQRLVLILAHMYQ